MVSADVDYQTWPCVKSVTGKKETESFQLKFELFGVLRSDLEGG